MSSDESSEEDVITEPRPGTPPELKAEAELAINDLLPPKSKARYMISYENFMSWKQSKNAHSFSENVFLAYFKELAQTKKSSTLWAFYSMIKATMQLKHNINLKTYTRLIAWLKRQSDGYTAKKSEIFTEEQVRAFLAQAPDDTYLVTKVIFILGIKGACRAVELTNMTTKNIEFQGDIIIFKLNDTKNKTEKSFVIRDEYLNLFKKYFSLRPENTLTDRLFLNYRNGKCTRQVIGRHKILGIPRQIASFLNLPNPHMYTGHCFRRTSKSLADEDTFIVRKQGKTEIVAGGVDDRNKKQNELAKRNKATTHETTSLGTMEQHTLKFKVDMPTAPETPGPSKIVYVKPKDPNELTKTSVDPLETQSQRCRFCLRFSEDCVPISPHYLSADATTLAFNNVEVKLHHKDKFLNVVCKDCDIKLQIMYDFVKDVKTAQESLVEVEVENRKHLGLEIVVVKTEFDENYDNEEVEDNDNDADDINNDEDDNDTKEGILNSVTVGKTTFTKQVKKRKNTASPVKPKKTKVADVKYKEFKIDIKEEVIDNNYTNYNDNTSVHTEMSIMDSVPSEADFYDTRASREDNEAEFANATHKLKSQGSSFESLNT